ncbi:hypothetical protein FG386_000262 [Cryptosporidium ryanae]|uniref:uncharacterized protein n=1 Tax=Cryptosporidium ryanae TaxID=515981 RepID=UPI00351A5FDE|nr:hypothetical protein FG386_000262 [Cryptosporidium ryanae]
MDSSKHLLATAGGDETIRIYNLKTRCDNGVLSKHRGSVTSVVISPNSKYMISCGEDKLVCLWRCSDWEPLLLLDECHEYTPISADFHPSMRLALSLDIKGNICLINLLEGKITGKYNLTQISDKNNKLVAKYDTFHVVKFNKNGKYYAIMSQKNLVISSILDEKLYVTLSNSVCDQKLLGSKQITCFTWITDEHFIIGLSNGDLRLFMIHSDELVPINIEFKLNLELSSTEDANPHNNNRIKGIKIIENNESDDFIRGKLVSCDSSGIFSLFKFSIPRLRQSGVGKVYQCKCVFDILDIISSENRITCMTIRGKSRSDSKLDKFSLNNVTSVGKSAALQESTNKKARKKLTKKVNKHI